jgi:hypothetical protein
MVSKKVWMTEYKVYDDVFILEMRQLFPYVRKKKY